MARTIRELYQEGKRVYVSIVPTVPTRKRPSPLAMQLPLDLAEILFRPAPSPCGGALRVVNKHKAEVALQRMAIYLGVIS